MNISNHQTEIISYLKLFNMDQVFTADLIKHMSLVHFKKGEEIINLNSQIDQFYILVEGKLKVYTLQENGKKVLIRFYNPQSIIGDLEYTTDYPAKAIIETLRDSTLITISIDILRALTYDNPMFLRFIIKNVSHKLYTYSNMASLNLVYPLENRLASYLVSINDITINKQIDEIKVCKMEEMAELLCVSYRHLSRVLNTFVEQGILLRNRGQLRIIDFKQLLNLSVGLYE